MSLQPQAIPPIPEETARVARAIFPSGNRYMRLRDELGTIYTDEQFVALYPANGQFAEQPWRIALLLVMQYMENYTDRPASFFFNDTATTEIYTLSLHDALPI